MERRKALALSAVATLMVLTMMGMAFALVRMTLDGDDRAASLPVMPAADGTDPASTALAGGGPVPLEPVIEYLDVYEVVPGSFSAAGTGTTPTDAGQTAPAAASTATGTGSAPATSPGTPSPGPVTTSPPRPTITAPPPAPTTTTTTRPPGVPSDWPADKPIPPMPAGCQDPQLEDNGVWNCQH